MKGTFVEVKTYGDDGPAYTNAIFYSEEERDIYAIMRNFKEINGITQELNNLPRNMVDDVITEFQKFLKKEGFIYIKTKSIVISD
jgi:hypothetical protein